MAARRLGRLDGFAYQSPPPSYWSRAIVSLVGGAEGRGRWAEGAANAQTSATLLTTAIALFHPLPATLCPLPIFLLLHNRIRPIPRHAELPYQLSHDIARRATFGHQCARAGSNLVFPNRRRFRSG